MLWTDGVTLVAAQTPDGLARALGIPRASVDVMGERPIAAMADELGPRSAFLIVRLLAAVIKRASPLASLVDLSPGITWRPIPDGQFVFAVKDGGRRAFYSEDLSVREGVVADRGAGEDGVPHWYLR